MLFCCSFLQVDMYRHCYSHPITAILKLLRVLVWAANRCIEIILPWAVPTNQASLVPANRVAAVATRGHQHDVVRFGSLSLIPSSSREWVPPSPSSVSEPSSLDMLPVPSLPLSGALSQASSPTTNVSRKRCRGDDVKDDDNKAQLKRHETDFYWLPEVNPAVWQLPPNLGQKQAELVKSEEVQESSVAIEQATSRSFLQSLPQQVPTSSLPVPINITVDAAPLDANPVPDVVESVPLIDTLDTVPETAGASENFVPSSHPYNPIDLPGDYGCGQKGNIDLFI
jgi:hypothetical protein